MLLNKTSNLIITLFKGLFSYADFSVTKNLYYSFRICCISLTICDLQIISQFSWELCAYFYILSFKDSRLKMFDVYDKFPSKLYFFIIYVPFCNICFSHLSYLGLLDIWFSEIVPEHLSKFSNLSYTGHTLFENYYILGIGSLTPIEFFGSNKRNFFS